MEPLLVKDLLRLLFFVIIIYLWLYWLWTRRNLYKYTWKFPCSFGLPILGHALQIGSSKNLIPFFEQQFRKVKSKTICVWVGTKPFLATIDPDMIEKILLSPHLTNKAKIIYKALEDFFMEGLVTSEGKKWVKNRRLVNPAFSHKVLLSFFTIFKKGSSSLVNKFHDLADDGAFHDVFDSFLRLNIAVAVETTMGKVIQEGHQVDEKIIEAFICCASYVTQQILLSLLHIRFLFKFHITYQRGIRTYNDFVTKLIREKLELRQKSQAQTISNDDDRLQKNNNIFVDRAIDLYIQKEFDWNDMLAESNTLVAAATDTTAVTMFSTVVLLAMHPEIQERLFEEIFSAYPQDDFEVKYEDLNDLPYLDMVIKEVLRLIPSVPMIARQVVQDTQIGNDVLPKGMMIALSIFTLHRDKDLWGEDAEEFKPERFSSYNMSNIHPYMYLPFSKGSRNCLGWKYALYSTKVAIINLVRNFRFETDMKLEELEFIENISMHFVKCPKIKTFKRLAQK